MFLPAVLLIPVNNDYKVTVSQDALGNYKIIYHIGTISKIEERHQDGTLFATYSFIDANGKPQTISYFAGKQGFRVISSTLPQSSNTQQVAEVKQKQLEEVRRAIDELEKRLSSVRPLVPFAPELVKVTIEHLKAVEIAKIAARQGGYTDCVLPELLVTNSPEVIAASGLHLAQIQSVTAISDGRRQ